MEDSRIIDLYWKRSDRAIAETDKKYGAYCRTIAYNICRSREDTDECINDTWLKAWNTMPDKRPDTLSAYLGRITRNLALDKCRARTAEKRGGGELFLALEELAHCSDHSGEPEKQFDSRELERAVAGFVDALPETERRVFVSRYWYMASVAEIAEKAGFSHSKVKMMLFRMRGKLRSYLEKEGLI